MAGGGRRERVGELDAGSRERVGVPVAASSRRNPRGRERDLVRDCVALADPVGVRVAARLWVPVPVGVGLRVEEAVDFAVVVGVAGAHPPQVDGV